MRRIAAALILSVALTACTNDADPKAIESPTATASGAPTAQPPSPQPRTSPTPTPTASDEPTPTPTDTATATPTATATATETAAPSPTTKPSDPAKPAVPREPVSATAGTPVAYPETGTIFTTTSSATRGAVNAACKVQAAADEVITACVSGYSQSRSGYVVAVESESNGSRITTIYASSPSGFKGTIATQPYSAGTVSLSMKSWANHDDLLLFDVAGQGTDLVVWNGAGDPRVIAHFPATLAGNRLYTAQTVLLTRESGGHVVEVMPIPTSGTLSGTRTTVASGDRTPEEVAIKLHDAWSRGARPAGAALAIKDVVTELYDRNPTNVDVYDFNSCSLQSDHFLCTMTANYQGTRTDISWEVIRTGGELVVGYATFRQS